MVGKGYLGGKTLMTNIHLFANYALSAKVKPYGMFLEKKARKFINAYS